MSELREIKPQQIVDNVFKLIGKDWMLITAGTLDHYNTMTASWGGLGLLWNAPVAFVFIRPQRHTLPFVVAAEYFSLCFFDEVYRDALSYCGTHSGRDVDKAAATGLSPVAGDSGIVHFAQARLVLECRKLYVQDLLQACFVESRIPQATYAAGDYHRMFVGEIVQCLAR